VTYDLDGTSYGVFVEGDYAYVGDGEAGLKVIEVRRNKVRQFESPSYAQSMPIFDAPHHIFSATLNSTATVPADTSINYFLSADNGLNWEPVTLGMEHVFVHSGTQLRWKAEMITPDPMTTPEISEISIDYTIENSIPLANAGSDQVVRREGVPLWVQLDGGLSYDPDGDPIVCLWTMTSRPEGSSAIIADPMSVAPRFVADLRGEYIVELIVSDPWTSSFPDTVAVTRENNRPIISWAYIDFRKRVFGSHLDVGINQLNEIKSMTWLACDTYDGDQDSLTHDWSIISKPPGSLAEIPPSFDHLTLEMIGIDLSGYYLIQFVVNDGYEDSLPAYVSINVLDTDIFDLHEEGETIITEHDTDGTPGSDVWVTLTEVTDAGDTAVDASPTGPADPSGFELAGVYYDISTDATYEGPVMISMNYDDTGLTLEEEQNLRLYHYEIVDPGADPPVWGWVNVTVLPVDTDNNIICGQVSSLSWIAVGIQLPEVQITFPPENTALMDGVTFEAQAVGAGDITEVNFYIRKPGGDNGIPIGYESLPATYDSISDRWQYDFDTTELSNGKYVLLANAKDNADKEGWSEMVPFSIRNWAVLELLPNTPNNKAGRTMPIKFALRISDDVDVLQPFAYSEELEIRIFDIQNSSRILQTSTYGDASRDYRIDMDGEQYITNFQTKKNIITTYIVEIWKVSNNFKVGSFTFETVK
jgi:hypothetical protein